MMEPQIALQGPRGKPNLDPMPPQSGPTWTKMDLDPSPSLVFSGCSFHIERKTHVNTAQTAADTAYR